jgi:hypothetical protein
MVAAVIVAVTATGASGASRLTASTDARTTNIASAIALARLVSPSGGDRLDLAVLGADRATAIEATALGVSLREVAAPAYVRPSDALAALAARTGVAPTAAQVRAMRSFDDLAEPARTALTGVLDAFLAFDAASRDAFSGADRTRLAAAAGATALTDAGVDVGGVLTARETLLHRAVALRDAIAANGVRSTLNLCPAVAIDLTSGNDTYTADCALIIDTLGDDTYLNNAGGNAINSACDLTQVSQGPAGALIDTDGDDQYISGRGCGINGGGFFGAGFLLDTDGNDTHTAGTFGTNGGGRNGVGLLVDSDGADTYRAGDIGTNGGGDIGAGLLIDAEQNDTYTAGAAAVNGGGDLGVGMLVDAQGDDTYNAGSQGANGGGEGGDGKLIDVRGVDSYTATGFSGLGLGSNGAGDLGLGLLLDTGGFGDTYSDFDGGTGTDRTVVPKGIVGAQVDLALL